MICQPRFLTNLHQVNDISARFWTNLHQVNDISARFWTNLHQVNDISAIQHSAYYLDLHLSTKEETGSYVPILIDNYFIQ